MSAKRPLSDSLRILLWAKVWNELRAVLQFRRCFDRAIHAFQFARWNTHQVSALPIILNRDPEPSQAQHQPCRLDRVRIVLTIIAKISRTGVSEVCSATLSASLHDLMTDWGNAQARAGRYPNASDHVRDMIAGIRSAKIRSPQCQSSLTDGLASGMSAKPERWFFEAQTRVGAGTTRSWCVSPHQRSGR
jgi:Arc/MetJ-type ribon-helix-helix transcriptional regulator